MIARHGFYRAFFLCLRDASKAESHFSRLAGDDMLFRQQSWASTSKFRFAAAWTSSGRKLRILIFTRDGTFVLIKSSTFLGRVRNPRNSYTALALASAPLSMDMERA